MTLTDKEKLWMAIRKYKANDKKIEEALKEIDELIKHYKRMKNAMKEGLADFSIQEFEGIKKILEK